MQIKRISDGALVYSDTKGVTAAASTPDPDAPRPAFERGDFKIYRNTENLTGTKVVSAPADPLVAAARNGGKITPTTVKREPYNINAFGASDTAGKRTGNMLGESITDMGAATAEALANVPAQLSIGEQARLAVDGKTSEVERQAAEKIKRDTTKAELQEKADELAAKRDEYSAAATEGLNGVGRALHDLGVGGTQLVTDAALGALVPGLGTVAMGTRVFGSSAQQARHEGATESQQRAYGLSKAATAVLLGKLSQVGGVFKKAYGGGIINTEKVVSKLLGKVGNNPALVKLISGFIGEAGEEGLEQALDPVWKAIYDKSESINHSLFGSEEEFADYLADIGYSALIGGALGTLGAGADVITRNTTTEAQNTPPNAAASRVGATEGSNATAPQNGTEAIVGANENGLISLTEQEKANLSSGVRNKVVTTFQDAVQFVRNALLNKDNTDRAYLGKIPNNIAQQVLRDTGIDVAGMGVMMNGINIRHIMKDHGDPMKEAARGQVPVTAEDIAKIPEIIATPDNVRLSDRADGNGRKAIVFEKQFGDTYITIQGVSNGKKLLQTDTMYIKKGKPRKSQFPMTDAESIVPAINAQSDLPQRLSTDNVAQAAPVVKRDVFAEDVRSRVQNPSIGAADAGFDPFSALENKYGAIGGKARSMRPDDVPRSITGDDRVSETAVTLKGAEATPEWFVPVLKKRVLRGDFSTIPITNDETVQKAIAAIEGKSETEAVDDWIASTKGRVTQDEIVMGQLLYNHAVNKGDEKLANKIIDTYVEMGRDTARALQAMSVMQKLSPKTRLQFARSKISQMVKELELDVDIFEDAKFKELEDAYLNAKSDKEADAILDDIAKHVATFIPTNFWDAVQAIRYTNMLGNLKTQVRNVTGNIGMYGVSGIKDKIAANLQRLVKSADQTRSAVVEKEYRNIGAEVFEQYESLVLQQGKYQEGAGFADDFKSKVKEHQKINQTGIKALDKSVLALYQKYNDLTQFAMNNKMFGDAAFARKSFARAFGGYLKAKGITPEQWNDAEWQKNNGSLVEKAVAFAAKDAQENTFRNANALAEEMARIAKGKSPALKFLIEGLLPFRTTPANIFRAGFDYSPLGVVNTLVSIGRQQVSKSEVENQFLKKVQKVVGKEDITANDIIEQLSKGLTGTGIVALGAVLASLGLLRGGEDEDENQAAMDALQGHQPYSIEIGNHSYTLDWFTPASMPLFVGVELYNALSDGGISWGEIGDTLMSVANPMLEMSMMSGLNDAISNVQYSDNAILQFIANSTVNYLTQIFTNTLLGQIERTFEPNRMTTYVDKNKGMSWLQYAKGKASAKTPLWDYQQTEYIDAWGRTESNGSFVGRAFQNFLSPGYYSKISTDPLEAEIQRLYNTTGENVFPERPEKYFTVDGERVDLTAEQYTEYATKRGNELYNLMQKVVESSAYKKASDSGKAEMLSDAKTYATKTAKEAVSDYEVDGWVAKAKNTGIAPEKYIAVLSELNKANEGSDSITQAEAQKALDATGLSRAEKAKMWNNINKQWKTNPYK